MNIVIANGMHQADFIIQNLKKEKHQLTIINENEKYASYITNSNKIPVLVGDPTKAYILEDADIQDADVFIALSENDIDNYVACITAKRIFNVKRTVCVVKNPKRVDLFKKLGIDSVISSTYLLSETIRNESIVESIIKTISLENDKIMVTEITVEPDFIIASKKLKNANLPPHIIISCIFRDPEVIIPSGETIIRPKDKIIVVTTPDLYDMTIDTIRKTHERERTEKH